VSYVLNAPGGATATVRERIQPVEGGWERAVEVSGVPGDLEPALVESPVRGSTEQAPGKFTWAAGGTMVRLRVEGATPLPSGQASARVFRLTPGVQGRFTGRVRLTVGGTD